VFLFGCENSINPGKIKNKKGIFVSLFPFFNGKNVKS
jgi:hypothetical protein